MISSRRKQPAPSLPWSMIRSTPTSTAWWTIYRRNSVRGKEPPLPPWGELERMRKIAMEAAEIPEVVEAAEEDTREFIKCLIYPNEQS